MSEASAQYRDLQPPKWRSRYSFALLYVAVFVAATFPPVGLAILDGVDFSGQMSLQGLPYQWLRISSFAPYWSIIGWLELIQDLCIYAAVCAVVVYSRQLIRMLYSLRR